MRGKLQIVWDLTFNSMYELFILLAYLYYYIIIKVYLVSLASNAIHKNNIPNQMRTNWLGYIDKIPVPAKFGQFRFQSNFNSGRSVEITQNCIK